MQRPHLGTSPFLPVGLVFLLLALIIGASPGRAQEPTPPPAKPPVRAKSITLIHIGDIHGHLTPRPNLRRDATGKTAGGLARMYTVIEDIRRRHKSTLLLNTGDTIQGSAEALFTRGQALVDVLNLFRIDAYTPGNWDYVYGAERFIELFGRNDPKAPWRTVAANLYYDGAPYEAQAGKTVVPSYRTRTINGLKIAIIGLTTRRGPQVVGLNVTKGFKFTGGDEELPRILAELRERVKPNLVILLSEQELANNIRLAEANPGIDVILSADMHEVTRRPVVTRTGTIIVEEGQDGTRLGELRFEFKNGRRSAWTWTGHDIDERITENALVAAKIRDSRRPFVAGSGFVEHTNPFSGARLKQPIDTVVGHTKVPLHRAGFTDDQAPAVIEGSSHNFLTDAFRAMTSADIGGIRGFRYGTHVAPGPIRREDLYHFIPIGPMIAKGTVKGQQLKNQLENSADGALTADVRTWSGGWLFNFSGLTADIDPGAPKGQKATNIRVKRVGADAFETLDPAATYTYASYHYAADPTLINVLPATDIQVLRDESGQPLDGVDVVVRYLATLPNQTVDDLPTRLRLITPLPKPAFGNPEIQPLRGVPTR